MNKPSLSFRIPLIMLLALFFVRTRAHSECHVSSFGNDSFDCSSFANPCLSLSQCLTNCQSECTIVSELVLASTSNGNSGITIDDSFPHPSLSFSIVRWDLENKGPGLYINRTIPLSITVNSMTITNSNGAAIEVHGAVEMNINVLNVESGVSEHGSVLSFQTTSPLNINYLSVNDIQGGECALLFCGPLVNITNYSANRVSSSSSGACFLTKQPSDVVILSGEDNVCSNSLSTEASCFHFKGPGNFKIDNLSLTNNQGVHSIVKLEETANVKFTNIACKSNIAPAVLSIVHSDQISLETGLFDRNYQLENGQEIAGAAIVLEHSNFVFITSVDFINIDDSNSAITWPKSTIEISNSHFITLNDCNFQMQSEHSSAVLCQSGSSNVVMNKVSIVYKNTNSSFVDSIIIDSDGSLNSILLEHGYVQCVDCPGCDSVACVVTQDEPISCICAESDPYYLSQQMQDGLAELNDDSQRIVAIVLLALILVFGFLAIFVWFSVLSAPEKNLAQIEEEYIQVPDYEHKLPLHYIIKL